MVLGRLFMSYGLDVAAMEEARERHLKLTKPAGSLGRIEEIGIRLAGIYGTCPPPVPVKPVVVVAASDHGVLAEGVSPWPMEVTAQMVANFVAGGAAINAISHEVGAEVVVVDAGINCEAGIADAVLKLGILRGTGNIAREPAMSGDEASRLVEAGIDLASSLVSKGVDLLATGDMGIGNTTPSACIVAKVTGATAASATGRGTGIDDATWEKKVSVVDRALLRVPGELDGYELLSQLGGAEIGFLAGLIIGGARSSVPVVVDGVISLAALLIASRLEPACVEYVFAGHRSLEPGATLALDYLKLSPLLELGLRLGEGTGAALAVPLIRAGARILNEMATFDSAGVSSK
jgi:nicotinate-nucleotide--dimethylbenzimidazole phosphoribosyltransferase